jgi:capsular polysaccharide export protein
VKSSTTTIYAVGFYPWKRRILRALRPEASIKFIRSPRLIPRHQNLELAAWGLDFAKERFPKSCRLTRYEDGFIRSIGLGAAFAPAYSWVADSRGMYFDASQPSDLEVILQQENFPYSLLERARALHRKILNAGLTKYNLAANAWSRPPSARRVILVPGQVESDSSIRYGSPNIHTNIGLLQAVRGSNYDAYIVYKPHPDVVAGRRRSGLGENKATDWCDEVVADASMDKLLQSVDEVHVLTSLAGFEGLLRGKRVVTYGQPFYAGWGLTEDRFPVPRRRRKLDLSELIAGALIKYPLYLSPSTGRPCTPEQLIDELSTPTAAVTPSFGEKILQRVSSSSLWSKLIAK